ncbi:MAG: hypothetical protein U0M31_09450 [Oscillospiraceae bacterium]|nr:hypothetical protein [Oscillospiraceae bacterium]
MIFFIFSYSPWIYSGGSAAVCLRLARGKKVPADFLNFCFPCLRRAAMLKSLYTIFPGGRHE